MSSKPSKKPAVAEAEEDESERILHYLDDSIRIEACYLAEKGAVTLAIKKRGAERIFYPPRARDKVSVAGGPFGERNVVVDWKSVYLQSRKQRPIPPSPSSEEQDGATLFKDVRLLIKEYLFWNEDFYSVGAAYVLASGLVLRFRFFPYLQFLGAFGSGKTQTLRVLRQLCYHGFKPDDASPSALARIISPLQPTLFIDEIDKQLSPQLEKLLRHGTDSDSEIPRCNADRSYTLSLFSPYAAKVLAGQEPLTDPALASRVFLERLQIATKALPEVNGHFATRAAALQSRLMRWWIDHTWDEHWQTFRAPKIGRDAQCLTPLLAVAPESAHNEILSAYRRSLKTLTTLSSDQTEGLVMRGLALLIKGSGDRTFYPGDVVAALVSQAKNEGVEAPQLSPGVVGATLKRNSFTARATKKGTEYFLPKTRHEEIRRRGGGGGGG